MNFVVKIVDFIRFFLSITKKYLQKTLKKLYSYFIKFVLFFASALHIRVS
jgi:hypothetical protein